MCLVMSVYMKKITTNFHVTVILHITSFWNRCLQNKTKKPIESQNKKKKNRRKNASIPN